MTQQQKACCLFYMFLLLSMFFSHYETVANRDLLAVPKKMELEGHIYPNFQSELLSMKDWIRRVYPMTAIVQNCMPLMRTRKSCSFFILQRSGMFSVKKLSCSTNT